MEETKKTIGLVMMAAPSLIVLASVFLSFIKLSRIHLKFCAISFLAGLSLMMGCY